MDSLTQIVLGAAVGEVVLGKKIGNKAMVLGAIAGTIPDLDVLLGPFVNMVDKLYFHRSFTHSIFFAIIFAPLFAWLSLKIIRKFKDGQTVTFKEMGWLYFWGFFTHALLDCFTTWGTKLFYPLTDYAVSFYSIFVIDPIYTLPFIILLIIAAFHKRDSPRRAVYNWAGIILSSVYLMISVVNKNVANGVFEQNLSEQKIQQKDYISKPTIMNTVLWSISAKSDSGFYLGLHSLLDKTPKVDFRFEPQNKELLNPYLPNERLERLLGITKGYYTVEKAAKGVYINDLRFGEFNGWQGEGGEFVFVYHVWQEDDKQGELQFEQKEYGMKQGTAELSEFWERLNGK